MCPESYVHRIGRTARAGAEGVAIAFCAGDERSLLKDIERTIRQSIPVVQHALGKSNLPPAEHEARRPNGRPSQPHGQKRQWNPMGKDGGKPARDNRSHKLAVRAPRRQQPAKAQQRRQALLDAGNQRRQKRPPPRKNGRVT